LPTFSLVWSDSNALAALISCLAMVLRIATVLSVYVCGVHLRWEQWWIKLINSISRWLTVLYRVLGAGVRNLIASAIGGVSTAGIRVNVRVSWHFGVNKMNAPRHSFFSPRKSRRVAGGRSVR
jgi:hypothetical protein